MLELIQQATFEALLRNSFSRGVELVALRNMRKKRSRIACYSVPLSTAFRRDAVKCVRKGRLRTPLLDPRTFKLFEPLA